MKITVNQLTKSYGQRAVLQGFCTVFRAGAVNVVMGPSGCGKTTLLRILMGLETPDFGTVTGLEGQRISAVFQEDRLCGAVSARGNLALVCDAPRAQLTAALAAFGIDAAAAAAPAAELSGGQARRVAILRCLLAQSEVLIFDEPLKGLDAKTRELVLGEIAARRGRRTVIWVTHDAAEAAFWQTQPILMG